MNLTYSNRQASNVEIIVHQAYAIGRPCYDGRDYPTQAYRIAFLCPIRGLVTIFRTVRVVSNEFDQGALVRAEILKFRNA